MKERVTCHLCSRHLTYKPGGTTSNLLKHLSSIHKNEWTKVHEQKEEPCPTNSRAGPLDAYAKKVSCPTGHAGKLTNAIVYMVAINLRPIAINIVDSARFNLMAMAESGYRVPSQTHIASLLKKKHEDGLAKLRTVLKSAEAVF